MASAKRAVWGVVVRLANGRQLFSRPGVRRQGQEDWSPRESPARRYGNAGGRRRVGGSVHTTNAQAREYLVIQLG
jgi:hypothetical protein